MGFLCAAHNIPPARKHIGLVGISHAFQGWDEKIPTKSQDKFSVAPHGHFLSLPPKSGAFQPIQGCCNMTGRRKVGPDVSKPKSSAGEGCGSSGARWVNQLQLTAGWDKVEVIKAIKEPESLAWAQGGFGMGFTQGKRS